MSDSTTPAPGRGLFKTAAVLMIVMAVAHTIVQVAIASRADPELLSIHERMREHRAAVGLGLRPTMLDMVIGASMTMSVTLLALGITGLIVAGGPGDGNQDRLLRRLAWLGVAWVGALIVVYARHLWVPALVFAALIELALLAYLMVARPAQV